VADASTAGWIVIRGKLACGADLEFVLAENNGLMVLQKKTNQGISKFQSWDLVICGEGLVKTTIKPIQG
jgi:hypothetical protein